MLPPERLARAAAIRERAIRDAEEYVRSHIWALEDASVQELYQLFLSVFADLSNQLFKVFLNQSNPDAWSTADPGYRQRTEQLLAQIGAAVEQLMAEAQDAVFNAAWRAYQGGAMGRAWLIDLGLRGAGDVTLPVLPQEAIRFALLAPYQGLTFIDRFANARTEFEQLIRRSIVESQISGEGIAKAARRLRDALGVKQGDPKSLFSRTEMIARTEILRASNQGAFVAYEANKDILTGWRWLASRDERVCPICGALDGQQFTFDSPQSIPPQHPRCRCTQTPVLADDALYAAIVGPRESYTEWAARRGVSIVSDGGVMKFRGMSAPVSSTPAAQSRAPNLYP